ncbi:A-kinase anchor protein 14 [Macrotis lagotis]|uniref:A-kinase anchor protein 14 n=1 Tax=Macrotis lagotis TaxID=92651 RepID=UPI003D68D8F0
MDLNTSSSNTTQQSVHITEDAILTAVKTLEDTPVKNINWASCEDFTVDLGREQIEEYISTWEFHDNWLHWCDYMAKEELEFSVCHHYRVRWSTPTARKPMPRATACMYFFIEVSKIKPKNSPVKVVYVLEGNRYVHRPGKSRFQEKWLKDIIESKIILMDKIDF